MTKGEIVFMSNNPFCDERRLLRCFQVVLFKDSSGISSLHFRTCLLFTSDKFPCSRLTMHSLRNWIISLDKFLETEFCMGRKSAGMLGE